MQDVHTKAALNAKSNIKLHHTTRNEIFLWDRAGESTRQQFPFPSSCVRGWFRLYPNRELREADKEWAKVSYSLYIPQPHLRAHTHQTQIALLFSQCSVPKYIKALMSWQRRKQILTDRTVFCHCKYLPLCTDYLTKIIKYKCPIKPYIVT